MAPTRKTQPLESIWSLRVRDFVFSVQVLVGSTALMGGRRIKTRSDKTCLPFALIIDIVFELPTKSILIYLIAKNK